MTYILTLSSRICLVLGTLALNGCISLLPEAGPPPAQITLEPQAPASHLASSKTLQIEDPSSPINFNGTKIVIRKTNEAGLSVFTFAQEQEWTETLPKMMQRALLDHLKTPAWPGVVSEAKTIVPDYKLSIDIRKFNIVLAEGVEVSVNLTLINNNTHKIEATKTLHYVLKSEHNVKGYMQAFNQAMTQLIADTDAMLRKEIIE